MNSNKNTIDLAKNIQYNAQKTNFLKFGGNEPEFKEHYAFDALDVKPMTCKVEEKALKKFKEIVVQGMNAFDTTID